MAVALEVLRDGIPTAALPAHPGLDASVVHAPRRPVTLTAAERQLALSNVLRYFATELHAALTPEFAEELDKYGHIYCYRLRPVSYAMRAHSLDEYPAECRQAACIMLMIQNNLDPRFQSRLELVAPSVALVSLPSLNLSLITKSRVRLSLDRSGSVSA